MQIQSSMEPVTHLIDYTMSSQWEAVGVSSSVVVVAVSSMMKHYIKRNLDDEIAGI